MLKVHPQYGVLLPWRVLKLLTCLQPMEVATVAARCCSLTLWCAFKCPKSECCLDSPVVAARGSIDNCPEGPVRGIRLSGAIPDINDDSLLLRIVARLR